MKWVRGSCYSSVEFNGGVALGTMTISDFPVEYGEMSIEHRFGIILAQASALILRYIGGLWIGTSRFPLYRLMNICAHNILLLTGGSAAIPGYRSVARRCFVDTASALNINSSSLFLL
ncbi:hypothetical protein HAX54_039467 [Datura stramonium]|uniref:Uncharacterized protein n=1 Tax=Datura stramonium TaxID=4076 RepID=A0ABS8VN48_DATST|nr:hypothetical protein [Datura stramonium]